MHVKINRGPSVKIENERKNEGSDTPHLVPHLKRAASRPDTAWLEQAACGVVRWQHSTGAQSTAVCGTGRYPYYTQRNICVELNHLFVSLVNRLMDFVSQIDSK